MTILVRVCFNLVLFRGDSVPLHGVRGEEEQGLILTASASIFPVAGLGER